MFANRTQTLAFMMGALSLGACLDAEATDPGDADEAVSDEAQAISGGDNTPEPVPSPIEVIEQGGVFSVAPGTRICFPELAANQSATLSGSFSYRNFVKYPKLIVYHRFNTSQPQIKHYTGSVIPDAGGFYQKSFSVFNGNAGLFPGRFQFCLRNNAANPGPFTSNAQVVTF